MGFLRFCYIGRVDEVNGWWRGNKDSGLGREGVRYILFLEFRGILRFEKKGRLG